MFLKMPETGKIQFFQGMSSDEVRSHYTDRYIARFHTTSSLAQLLRAGLETAEIRQKSELRSLPRKELSGWLKSSLLRNIADEAAKLVLSRAGMFAFATALKKPQLSVR